MDNVHSYLSLKMNRGNCQGYTPLRFLTALLLITGSLVLARLTRAQEVNASLYGTVSDSSGGAVPGATITATAVATGVANRTVSDATGSYILVATAHANARANSR